MFQHAWASFCADFPDDPAPEESRCQGVGDYLAARLKEAGVHVIGIDIWRDCGYQVDCLVNDKVIYFFVSHVGQGPVQYVLCCTSNRGLFAWLKGVDDTSERWQLASAVHGVMAVDPHFHDIRWYVERGWTAGGDEPWERTVPAVGG